MKPLLARILFLAGAILLVPACGGGSHSTPPPFVLLLPTAGGTGVSLNPTYSWTKAPIASAYLLQVATDPAFTTVVVHRPGLTTLSDAPPTALTAGTNYYWRVYASTLMGTILADGSPALFKTLSAPGPFSLQSPANADPGQSTSPLLMWTSSTEAASYTLQIATDVGFGSLVLDQSGILTTSYIPLTPLSPVTTYYWRVTAVNEAGTRLATGSPRSFTTLPEPPGSFSLTSPSAGAVTVPLSPAYSWTAAANAASYTLQVSTSPTFSSFLVNKPGLAGTSDTPAVTLSTSTLHYWRVTAVNANGSTLATGSPASFTTGPPASISISPSTTLSFTATAGGANPAGQNIQISNPNGSTSPLRWSVSSDQPWLQFSTLSGTTSTGTDIVSITPRISQAEAWTTATTLTGAPGARENFTQVWTGEVMIIWGGSVGLSTGNDGACYDPAQDKWVQTTSLTGAPSPRIAHAACWTGSRMFVWGGRNGGTYYQDGYLYDPRTNTWSGPVSTVNAPTARTLHSAVWTGTEVIIWGGYDGSVVGNGARYNPATNTWTSIQNTGAPTAREDHFAVWTGSRMLIWGGEDAARVNTGKAYDPATDTWGSDFSTVGAPTGRAGGASAWTGSELFVWGGITNTEFVSDVGGRYDPAADTWVATTQTNALSPRRSDQAVWAGTEAIVWGGYSEGEGYMNTGKRYKPPFALTPGVYTGTITITDPDATNSPRTINVTLTVTP